MTDARSPVPEPAHASDGRRTPDWVDPLCQIATAYRSGTTSLRELFERAAPDIEDARFAEIVGARLRREPRLVESWQQYSHDKRATPSLYLDGTEVGFAEVRDGMAHTRGVERFDTAVEACSSFIRREAAWVL